MKFTSKIIETVGELKGMLKKFPDDKPIILVDAGDSHLIEFYNWAESEDDDCDWPLAIRWR